MEKQYRGDDRGDWGWGWEKRAGKNEGHTRAGAFWGWKKRRMLVVQFGGGWGGMGCNQRGARGALAARPHPKDAGGLRAKNGESGSIGGRV